jgi:hypothetical protein
MKRSALIISAALIAATSAFAQNPAAQPGPSNNAVNSAGQAPVAARNSFTEGQAKSKIEGAGFTCPSADNLRLSGVSRREALAHQG